jgi:hypothetical protein
MDRIDALLDDLATEPLSPSVKHALKFAHNSINKYYSKTDQSKVYRIVMGESYKHIHLPYLIMYCKSCIRNSSSSIFNSMVGRRNGLRLLRH